MNYYTIMEISTHNKLDDCWIYVGNNVYNVTTFVKKHPGGLKSIMKYAGKDCSIHYNFHTEIGQKIWDKYKIGEIKNNNCCIIN